MRTIYNPVPIYMGDKPGALAVDYGVAYFTPVSYTHLDVYKRQSLQIMRIICFAM